MDERRKAILLLGPTGSGKTPLGEILESRGLSGRRCVHFDFGENLRRIVDCGQPDSLVSVAEIQFLRRVLQTGALLEDRDFPIAERVLRSFLARRRVDDNSLVVLNGLPRHVGQANSIARILDVQMVICLECSSETVFDRIVANAGGDRDRRADDDLPDVRRKLAVYAERTAPLVDHFRANGTRIVRLEVKADMTAPKMWELLRGRSSGPPENP